MPGIKAAVAAQSDKNPFEQAPPVISGEQERVFGCLQMEEFKLKNCDFINLNSLLKVTGLCDSGGHANVMITAGRVKVDGMVELRKRCKIRTCQVVEYAGNQVRVN